MGRDNEFRNYQKPQAATVSQSQSGSLAASSGMGANLRKHNFKFGYDSHESQKDLLEKSEQAKRAVYEYTKSSQKVTDWRKQQVQAQKSSHIQWGLKAEQSRFSTKRASKQKDEMNLTFTKMMSTSEIGSDVKIDSTRSAQIAYG